MIYYYFGGKEGLYLAVLEKAYAPLSPKAENSSVATARMSARVRSGSLVRGGRGVTAPARRSG
jgi:AcrR family transcriptional regulator